MFRSNRSSRVAKMVSLQTGRGMPRVRVSSLLSIGRGLVQVQAWTVSGNLWAVTKIKSFPLNTAR